MKEANAIISYIIILDTMAGFGLSLSMPEVPSPPSLEEIERFVTSLDKSVIIKEEDSVVINKINQQYERIHGTVKDLRPTWKNRLFSYAFVNPENHNEFYKVYKTNKIDYKILFTNVHNEITFQTNAKTLNGTCNFVSPDVIKVFYLIDEDGFEEEQLQVVIVSEAMVVGDIPSIEEVVRVDTCLRVNGISHNDLFLRKDQQHNTKDPLTLQSVGNIQEEFVVHGGNCFYTTTASGEKKIALIDFGSAAETFKPVFFGGASNRYKKKPSKKSRKYKKQKGGRKWSLKYKRSINCKKPKGFSQKQYCKRKNK